MESKLTIEDKLANHENFCLLMFKQERKSKRLIMHVLILIIIIQIVNGILYYKGYNNRSSQRQNTYNKNCLVYPSGVDKFYGLNG